MQNAECPTGTRTTSVANAELSGSNNYLINQFSYYSSTIFDGPPEGELTQSVKRGWPGPSLAREGYITKKRHPVSLFLL